MSYEYKFDKERCWFNSVCSHYNNPEKCYRACIRFMEFDYLYYKSHIPTKMQYPISLKPDKSDRESFLRLREIKDDIVNWVDGGNSLLIYSPQCGNGKTSWAIKLMQKYFEKVWAGNGFRCRGVFVNVTDFLLLAKENIKNQDDEFDAMRENIRSADLVIWDDIGVTALSKYDYDMLMGMINNRVLNGMSNIYTSNSTEEKMEEYLGQRLKSRIFNESEIIAFIGGDRRGVH